MTITHGTVDVRTAAKMLRLSPQRMRDLLRAGRVIGAVRHGEGARGVWSIALDPFTGRPRVLAGRRGPRSRALGR